MTFIQMLELACSCSSILQNWLYGQGILRSLLPKGITQSSAPLRGPVWGVFTGMIWTIFTIATGHWLLMPLNIFATLTHITNFVLIRKQLREGILRA
jgi:hypothetical protein